jgi:hypothetical protein
MRRSHAVSPRSDTASAFVVKALKRPPNSGDDPLLSKLPDLEAERIREPLIDFQLDRSHPDYLVRINLQERSKGGGGPVTFPFDRERVRFKAVGSIGVTAVGFAPGPPRLAGVAQGTTFSEWRMDFLDQLQPWENAKLRQPAFGFVGGLGEIGPLDGPEDDGTHSSAPYRVWTVPVEVCSLVVMNGHYFPLWTTGSVDGTIRVWGRPSQGEVAPLVSSFIADPKCSPVDPLVIAYDASSMKLQVG